MNHFNDTFSSCRNAIGSFVNYISQCQQIGIPFKIADDAMGDTRTSYQKYWKGGLNKNNNEFKVEAKEHDYDYENVADSTDPTHISSIDNKNKRNLMMRSAIVSRKIQNEDLQSGRQHQQSDPNTIQTTKRKRSDHFTKTNTMSCANDYNDTICYKKKKNNAANDSLFMLETLSSIQDMLSENQVTEEDTQLQQFSFNSPREFIMQTVRSQLVDRLLETSGDVSDSSFKACLDVLSGMYKSHSNIQNQYYSLQNILSHKSWVSLSRPVYQECLGTNTEGYFVYNLGRMSFGMFQPADSKCSVQSTHVNIGLVHQRKYRYSSSDVSGSESDNPANLTIEALTDNIIPAGLRKEVLSLTTSSDESGLYDYDIAVSLTIEPDNNNNKKRLRALMSVKGYMLPDPDTPNRFTVWFTGGRLEPAIPSPCYEMYRESKRNNRSYPHSHDKGNDMMEEYEREEDFGNFKDWQSSFNHQNGDISKNKKGGGMRSWKEQARIMAGKLLLGAEISNEMDWNGAMSYTLHRPVGGHGKTYIDVLYMDNDVLITRGNQGTVYVMASSAVPGRFAPITRNEVYSN